MSSTIRPSNPWLVIDNGRIVSAHRLATAARAAATKIHGAVATLPTVPRGCTGPEYHIGDAVRIDGGTAYHN